MRIASVSGASLPQDAPNVASLNKVCVKMLFLLTHFFRDAVSLDRQTNLNQWMEKVSSSASVRRKRTTN